MKNRKMLTIALSAAVILIFGVVIAYAALSSTLNATFEGITQSSLSWNVGFNTAKGSTINASTSSTGSTGYSCGVANVTATGITVSSTQISKPGDSCGYEFRITNNGSIPATVSSITALKPNGAACNTSGSTMTCGNLTYTLIGVNNGDLLAADGSSIDGKLIVQYNGESLTASDTTQQGGGFSIVYSQA